MAIGPERRPPYLRSAGTDTWADRYPQCNLVANASIVFNDVRMGFPPQDLQVQDIDFGVD